MSRAGRLMVVRYFCGKSTGSHASKEDFVDEDLERIDLLETTQALDTQRRLRIEIVYLQISSPQLGYGVLLARVI